MDYDFGNRPSSMYPRVGVGGQAPSRPAPHRPPANNAPPSAGLGIRVAIKPEYRITPPPELVPQTLDIPRSKFQFDFNFEKSILAEAEKENQNWSRVAAENQSSKTAAPTSSMDAVGDPVVNRYVASGLGREAVSLAVLNYGDNPIKVREFVKGFNLLREMGFSSKNVAEALAMFDNDTDKALAHFLNSSS